MYNYTDSLIEEYLVEWSQAQILKFKQKFGDDLFAQFDKAKDRLKTNGHTTDIQFYLSDSVTVDKLKDILLSLYDDKKDAQKKRIISGQDKEIRGKYRDLGIKQGYHVFEPLDVYASMDLGVNTGWCTAGRYGHYGHPEFTPSEADAKQHWRDYTKKGIRFFYLLNPDTMYGEYAIALYPKVLYVNKNAHDDNSEYIVQKTNVEIYDAEDKLDYSIGASLDLSDLTGENIILDIEKCQEIKMQGARLIKTASSTILVEYIGDSTDYVVPDGVTSIGDDAFYDRAGLASITIPDSVTSIGKSAFFNCTGLTSITIGSSVTAIGNLAFYGCTGLTSITIPDSVTSIGTYAFEDCTGLTSVTIPDGVTSIDNYTFYNCKRLTSVTIPLSVQNIGIDAFRDCSKLTTVTFAENSQCSSIGEGVFSGCKALSSVTIPDSVTSIGDYAFNGCHSLTRIMLGTGIISIGNDAFSGCTALISITIPDSVTSIGNYAFSYCTGLKSIMIPASVQNIRHNAFCHCSNLTTVTFAENSQCSSIGYNAFEGCTGLTSITIPESATSIGKFVFRDCDNLTNINYGGAVAQWKNLLKNTRLDAPSGCTVHCTDGIAGIGII